MTKLDKALLWFTPLIVLLVLVNQFYRVEMHGLSTWQGGGFGMFSSVDSINTRFFKIYLQIDGAMVPVKVEDDFSGLITMSRAEPTQENLQQLAMQIYEANWVQSGNFKFDASAEGNYRPVLEIRRYESLDSLPEQRVNIDGVRLEIWKTQFDSATNKVNTYKHAEYVYPAYP